MKKKITLGLALMLVLTMMISGCGKKVDNDETTASSSATETTAKDTTSKTENTSGSTENTTKETTKETTAKPTTAKPTTAKPTTAKPTTAKPTTKPTEKPTESKKTDLTALMTNIYAGLSDEEKPMVGNVAITSENSDFYVGIKDMKLVDGLASEALIGSIAHSVCLINVEDGTDIAQVKKDIKENINPRKWICVGVERDQVIVDSVGNTILVVIDAEHSEKIHDLFLKNAK